MRKVLLTLTLTFICACGAAPGTAGGWQPSSNSASSPVALTCTDSGAASSTWTAPDTAGSGPAILSAGVTGDSLSLIFAKGTPQFEVVAQPNAHFTMEASGQPAELPGSAGVRIVLRGFRGDMTNYIGQKSMTSTGPLLLETRSIGDFEGVVSFAAGVSGPACANVTSNESSLTFHFIPAH